MKSFKEELTLDERLAESREIIAKYPTRIPVIAEKYSKTDLPAIEKKKFLVPRDMSVGQFIYILSARLHLSPGKALFVFVNNTLPQTGKRFLLCLPQKLVFFFLLTSLSINICSCSDGLHLRDLQRRRWIRLHVLQQ
ncbi:unnamed protein product [Brassica rapa subsp. trilocularis]